MISDQAHKTAAEAADHVIQTLDYRFERKYLTQDLTKEKVEFILKNHPERFTEIFHQRVVNNIYFDTLGMNNYHDNVDGATIRRKYRIRWYGDLFGNIQKPILEIKIKQGSVGRKESYELQPFVLDRNFSKQSIIDALSSENIPGNVKHDLLSMRPMLLNSYTRKYYLSFNKLFRTTVDHHLTYYKIGYVGNTFLNKTEDVESIVLELKYLSEADAEARKTLDFAPLSLTKSSKYVQGFESIY